MPRSKHLVGSDVVVPAKLSGARPKGAQLREILTGLVTSLGTGALLPSERVLAENYGVARMTVRAEVDAMVAGGLLVRRHGMGTFVAGPKLVQSDALVSFSEYMRARGLTPGSQVLSATIRPAPDEVAERLAIEAGAPSVHIVRVRTADEVPIAYEQISLPAERFAGIEAAEAAAGSLWELLERKWSIRIGRGEQRISAVLPTALEARLLGITRRQPCFAIEGVTLSTEEEPVECGRSLYRGDRYDVLVNAHRR